MTSQTDNRRPGQVWRIGLWSAAGLLLLLPLIAMQFTHEVVWTVTDFATFGVMLATAGGLFELMVRVSGNLAYRFAAGIALAGAFLMVWANLAVGMIGSENNPANLMFAGVLLTGVVGGFVARLKADGMVRTMIAMAVSQLAVGGIVWGAGWGFIPVVTAVFTGIWLASAGLFWKAGRG